MAGSGKKHKKMFSLISKHLSLQCNETGFENNVLVQLKNDRLFVNSVFVHTNPVLIKPCVHYYGLKLSA
jgi:hypothetical protein